MLITLDTVYKVAENLEIELTEADAQKVVNTCFEDEYVNLTEYYYDEVIEKVIDDLGLR